MELLPGNCVTVWLGIPERVAYLVQLIPFVVTSTILTHTCIFTLFLTVVVSNTNNPTRKQTFTTGQYDQTPLAML